MNASRTCIGVDGSIFRSRIDAVVASVLSIAVIGIEYRPSLSTALHSSRTPRIQSTPGERAGRCFLKKTKALAFDSSVPCGLALSSWNYFLGVVPHPPGDETLARRLALARLDSPDLGW